jgi:hypothetical protein
VPEVRLIESAVWHDGNAASGGETLFWMIARQSRCDLRFDWPANVQLQGAAWDGRPLDPSRHTAPELAFRIDGLAAGSVHCLQLKWMNSSDATTTRGGLWRPKWNHGPDVPEYATVLPRPGHILLGRLGQQGRSEILKLRAENLMNLCSSANTVLSAPSNMTLVGEIDSALDALVESIPSEAKTLRDRWEPLRSAMIEKFEDPNSRAIARNAATSSLMTAAWRDARSLPVHLSESSPEITFWDLHSGLTIVAAGLAGLIGLTLFMRFRRRIAAVSDKLPFDPAAMRLLALGSLWWTWLRFGVIGLLLVGASAVLQWQSRDRTQVEAPGSTA